MVGGEGEMSANGNSAMSDYQAFLTRKSQGDHNEGFDPLWMPDFLFDFQRALVEWALKRGRAAIFADTGLGKTPMQLVWAENIVRKTNKRVLILTPLAVSHQTIAEAEKFGVQARRSHHGEIFDGITVTNYERLHLLSPSDFIGVVCDESSILKSFDGVRRAEITEFMRKLPYRLLATATAAPNDFTELGTSSEAIGELGCTDMLNRFFKNDTNTVASSSFRRGELDHHGGVIPKWRFKGHAEIPFWRWVASWARAIRKPSDFGCEDGLFNLPPLTEQEHIVAANRLADGFLLPLAASGLQEQREEARRTIQERCEKVATLVNHHDNPALVWCHMNAEGDLLSHLIPDSVQVSGKDSDDAKEEKFLAFVEGKIRVLVTKPKIGAWGLNFQHCAHVTFFPSHSFEQYYQGVRRCWRFGQTRPVKVDVITTEGGQGIMKNLQRKAQAADRMFASLIGHMREAVTLDRSKYGTQKEEVPAWLS